MFKVLTTAILILVTISISIVCFYYFYYWGRILPNIKIAGIPVGGDLPEKAISTLENTFGTPKSLFLYDEGQDFEIKSSDVDLSYDYTKTVSNAYELYRTGNIFYDILGSLKLLKQGVNLGLRFELNPDKLNESLSVIAGQVAQDPTIPSVKIVDNQIIIDKGLEGKDVDLDKLLLDIGQNLAFARNTKIIIPTTIINPSWSDDDVKLLKPRAEKLIGKSLNFTFEDKVFSFADVDLINFLDKNNSYNLAQLSGAAEKIAVQINRDPENSIFVFRDGKAEEFKASREGIRLDSTAFSKLFEEKLRELGVTGEESTSSALPVSRIQPEITTSEVNNLGIKELIGRGESKFAGSIQSRIHNVGLAASHFNGVLIEPGKEVSFNEILGDVSSYTGYKQAYVIKDGKTVLGDGGGVCQVSTTLFRAILNAGLPVTERRAHSYRVGYYEQNSPPGLDATVYAPTTDLKFKNDTPGYILLQTIFDPKKYTLVFEIYGTIDGRVSSISKPIVSAVSAPPDDLYVDDPTLPLGVVKQVDYKAWGAKVTFDYKVERGGVIIFEKTFVSNYHPWQAKFLRGTGVN